MNQCTVGPDCRKDGHILQKPVSQSVLLFFLVVDGFGHAFVCGRESVSKKLTGGI